MKRILCKIFGHKEVPIVAPVYHPGEFFPTMIVGWVKCSRCGEDQYVQYDFFVKKSMD